MFKSPSPPLPSPHNRKKLKIILSLDKVSKTDRGGTLKRLLLRSTPRLQEPGKARQKSPSAFPYPRPSQFSSALGPMLENSPHSPHTFLGQIRNLFSCVGGAPTCRTEPFRIAVLDLNEVIGLACCSFTNAILN